MTTESFKGPSVYERGRRGSFRVARQVSTTLQPRRIGRRRAVDLRAVAAPFAVVLLALATWPIPGVIPGPGPDPAWIVGLNLILHQGYDFGSEVIFTYGPLGFLHFPVAVFPGPLRLAFGFVAVLALALAATMLWSARRALGTWWLAVPAAYVVTTLVAGEATLVLGFAAAVALIARRGPATPIAAGLGVLAGIEALGKVNLGVALLALGAIAALTTTRRTAAVLGGAWLATVSCGWIVTGQALAAIPNYVAGSLAISAGYASGMVYTTIDATGAIVAALAIGLLGAAVARRFALVAAWAVLWFVAFKIGFVRQDEGHPLLFAQDTLGALAVLAGVTRRRAAALAVLAPLLLFLALGPPTLAPRARLAAFGHQLGVLADPGPEIAAARQTLQAATPLDPETLAALRGKRVTVEPHAISIAFAYGIAWHPLPVIQGYAAYTPALDRRNAAALADPHGPRTILRQVGNYAAPIDLRNGAWDPPASVRAMLCHFRQVGAATGAWQVLERSANRCGAAHEIARVPAELDVPVSVPQAPPGELLYVEVEGFGLTPFERLRTLAYRARPRTIIVNGSHPFPVPPETAGDGLLLRVPVEADYKPAPFALDVAPQTLTFEGGGRNALTLRFVAQPIS